MKAIPPGGHAGALFYSGVLHGGAILIDEQRAKKIEAILRLQYPLAFSPLPSSFPRSLTDWKPGETTARPDDTRHAAARADAEMERAKLKQLTDDELQRRHEDVIAGASKAAEERARKAESQRLYNTPLFDADSSHWALMSTWEWTEFLSLSFGKNPHALSDTVVRSESQKYQHLSNTPSPFAQAYFRRRDLLERAVKDRVLPHRAAPGVYLGWADKYQIQIHEPLRAAVLGVNAFMDWQALCKQKDEELLELRALLAEKDAALSQSNAWVQAYKQRIEVLSSRLTSSEALGNALRETERQLKADKQALAIQLRGVTTTLPKNDQPAFQDCPHARLELLASLGGKYWRDRAARKWKFEGLKELEADLKAKGCKDYSEKTLRRQLSEHLEESRPSQATPFSGLGGR